MKRPAIRSTRRVVLHAQFDHRIQRDAVVLEHGVQRVGLRHGAGEAVQDEAACAIWLADALAQHVDDDLIGHQVAGVHDRFGAQADFRTPGHFGAQHVTGGDLGDPVGEFQPLCLRALARAWRAQKDQVQRSRPRVRFFLIRPSYWWASKWDCIWVIVSMVTDTMIISEVPPK